MYISKSKQNLQFLGAISFRKELQKDVDKLKKKIKATIAKADDQSLEEARKMYNEWMNLLDELLIVPGHQVIYVVFVMIFCCYCFYVVVVVILTKAYQRQWVDAFAGWIANCSRTSGYYVFIVLFRLLLFLCCCCCFVAAVVFLVLLKVQ